MSEANGDAARQQRAVSLAELEPGRSARIVDIEGGREMRRRCLALGLRPGTEIAISQSRRHGVVIGSDNTRVALGEGMAERVRVEPLLPGSPEVGGQ
jgi:ferrous iron transport protein A